MKYDFQHMPVNNRTVSTKWQDMLRQYPQVEDNIVPLAMADMELHSPPELVEGLKNFLDTTSFGYPALTEDYTRAVCGWMQRRHGWQIQAEWLLEWAGVVPALFTAVSELLTPQQGVIIMTPVYAPFYHAIEKAGCRLVENPLLCEDGHYSIDFADLQQKAKDPQTKLLILCSPHNPVGRLWTREELTRLGRICLDNDMLVIADEIHADLALDGRKHTMFASISEEFAAHSITCTAPSKTFNIAGLQATNVIIADAKLRQRIRQARERQGFSSLNSMAYAACQIVYNHCEPWLNELLKHIEYNRDMVCDYLAQNIPAIKPMPLEATYLLWLDCRGLGLGEKELETFLRQEARLFCGQGYMFGNAGAGFERLNLACPTPVLLEAMQRLKLALEKFGMI